VHRDRGLYVVGLVALATATATAIAGGCSTEEPRQVSGGTTAPDDGPSTPSEDFAVGDTIELGDFRFVVHAVTDPFPDNSETTSPSDDDRWVAVDAELTNLDDDAVTVQETAVFEVQDSRYRGFNVIDTGEDLPDVGGEIPGGESRRGTLVFEVSGRSTGLRLAFAGDVYASGSARIRLG
jgi:Domain of unknown function (DUF4352)